MIFEERRSERIDKKRQREARMICTRQAIGEVQIIIATLLFGLSFIGQRTATEDAAGPLTYNAWRYIVSVALLLPLKRNIQSVVHSDLHDTSPEDITFLIDLKKCLPASISEETFDLVFWGTVCGIANFSISTFQQYGLVTVTAGKAAFITGLFVVVIPIAEWILPFNTAGVHWITWLAVLLSGIGTYFLSNVDSSLLSIGSGEVLLFLGMLCCVVNIMAADAATKRVDCIALTCMEFSVTAALCTLASLTFEPQMWTWRAFCDGWEMIVLVGCTEAAAFLLSTLGQMYTPASRAGLLMSMESVATAVLGYLILDEVMTGKEILGCLLMFAGTFISSTYAEAPELLLPETDELHTTIKHVHVRTLSIGHVEESHLELLQRDGLTSEGDGNRSSRRNYGAV